MARGKPVDSFYFFKSPLFLAAFLIGVVLFAVSVLAFYFPAFTKNLPGLNILLMTLAVIVNYFALMRLKKKDAAFQEEAMHRERLLHDALERAESSDKARRAIIANMSHEFRTPLNSVIGFAELLAEGESDGERIEMARCVQRGGWELLDLVNSLVKAAELSNGDGTVSETLSFTLKELTSAVGASHEKGIRAKGLHFQSNWEGGRVYRGDMDSISAILGILVSNAVKYSDSGTIELRARELSVSDGNRVTIEFVVEDQGNGIDEETMAHLFRPFEQGEDPLTKRYSGMGVGLYNAKRITEKLRGDLRLESRMGVGTTAYLILPLVAEADKARGE